ncbi:unnamed protein product [Acanthoscelides obtectus]|uniref:Uncharacterized protein n=1 Tax=Acanthoscelides obtectus TaxID=200917 RepID=A0A9P0Q3A3_ACAOB|nr:unnamed protein product [Acanthoscelides obtectus]CAK1658388.1 hypothetical protein AOBTE_LOCUS20851 [Acanthoscelides obtectus]
MDNTCNVKENHESTFETDRDEPQSNMTDKIDHNETDTTDTKVTSDVDNSEESREPLTKQETINTDETVSQSKTATEENQSVSPLEINTIDNASDQSSSENSKKVSLVNEESMEQRENSDSVENKVINTSESNENCKISIVKITETKDEQSSNSNKSDKYEKPIDDTLKDSNAEVTRSADSGEKEDTSINFALDNERPNNDVNHTETDRDDRKDVSESKETEHLEGKCIHEENIERDEVNEEVILVNSENVNQSVSDPLDCNAVLEYTTDISRCSPCMSNRLAVSEDIVADESTKETPEVPDPEVQYRNVIRVDDNCILLQIAGELVEINVNTVNGKKVITVVPLSSSTVVDFNDNYDTVDNLSACDPLKIDEVTSESQDVEEKIGDPDFVEPSSEIIIGMDLNLEDEIQLDLEQPKPTLCTKAAKKAYDCDLQIPSITTSEDVYEKSNARCETNNDKVSSSKEKQEKSKRKHSKGSKDTVSKSSQKKASSETRSRKKSSSKSDEEFVPFADLVKARKLKKLKLKQLKDKCKADSTNKLDEVKAVQNDRVPLVATVDEDRVPPILPVEKVKERCTVIEKCYSEVKDDVPEQAHFAKSPKSPEVKENRVQVNSHEKNESSSTLTNTKLKEKSPPKVDSKRKLSLEEYNIRKRKLLAEKELAAKKANIEKVLEQKITIKPPERNTSVPLKRSMSVDDPKPISSQTKRSSSLEEVSKAVDSNCEEKVNLSRNQKDPTDLLNNNNHSSVQDEILRSYKEQVESKLSSLNLQIPKLTKPKPSPPNIIQRFLKNDKLTEAEVEKIKEIILCKKLMQLKSPETNPGSSSYEVRKEEETDIKLHFKKLPPKKKKLRFRNLYADSSESDEDFKSAPTTSSVTQVGGDYAVVQSNRALAGVVPKLIIKRKTELPLPVVRLERLNMGMFKKRKYE